MALMSPSSPAVEVMSLQGPKRFLSPAPHLRATKRKGPLLENFVVSALSVTGGTTYIPTLGEVPKLTSVHANYARPALSRERRALLWWQKPSDIFGQGIYYSADYLTVELSD